MFYPGTSKTFGVFMATPWDFHPLKYAWSTLSENFLGMGSVGVVGCPDFSMSWRGVMAV